MKFDSTQHGNNNAYCHDNEISWFDWSLLAKHGDVHRFVSLLCERRVLRSTKHERQRVSLSDILRDAKMAWHGVKLNQPDWGDGSNSMALGAELRDEGLFFHFIFNAFWEPLNFELPVLNAGNTWQRWIDTSLDSPNDIVSWAEAPAISDKTYRVADRSVVMLYSSTNGDRLSIEDQLSVIDGEQTRGELCPKPHLHI